MEIVKRKRVRSGKIWDAYVAAVKADDFEEYTITLRLPFGRGTCERQFEGFKCEGITYVVTGFKGYLTAFGTEGYVLLVGVVE
jgi:hypothetical protein